MFNNEVMKEVVDNLEISHRILTDMSYHELILDIDRMIDILSDQLTIAEQTSSFALLAVLDNDLQKYCEYKDELYREWNEFENYQSELINEE